jgi:hypothetical protein
MFDLWSVFDAVEEMLLKEKKSTKEQDRLLKRKDLLLTEQLLLVRRAKEEAQELAEAAVLAGDVESAGAEKPVEVGTDGHGWWYQEVNSNYLPTELDEVTKEPMYDVRVVAGKKNNRQRALAAAKVYGPKLREVSLAKAIVATGETGATSAASVRSSLGGLVRYGDEWTRERGSLIYLGGRRLPPDKEMILLLAEERGRERQSLTQAS